MKAKQYATQNLTMIIKNDTKISENYSSKTVRKWHLATFLLRNLSLVFLRKNALFQIEDKVMKNLNKIKRKRSCFGPMSRWPNRIRYCKKNVN
jgi:hypothetical protein